MTAVSQDIVFESPIDVAFDVIADFKKYPKFLKDVTAVKVLKSSKTSAEVCFTLNLIKKVEYTLALTLKAPTTVSWKLKSSDSLRKNSGSWKLKKRNAHSTLATYTLDVKFGMLVPGFISRLLIGSSLPATLAAFKKQIESPCTGCF